MLYNKKALADTEQIDRTILIVDFPFKLKDSYVQRKPWRKCTVFSCMQGRSSPCLQIGGYANSQVPPFTGRPYPGLFAKCKLA
jgi:hypothetical protein